MGIIKSENWDGVTAPAIPSGWTATANIVTTTGANYSSPNSVNTNTTGSNQDIYTNANDGNGGDAQAFVTFQYNSIATGPQIYVICRMTVPSNFNTGIGFQMSQNSGFRPFIRAGGANKTIGSFVAPSGWGPSSAWFQMGVICVGTSVQCQVIRLSDGKYCDSSGVWQTAVSYTHSFTDTNVSGAGSAGLRFFFGAGDTNAIYADDFLFQTAPVSSAGMLESPTMDGMQPALDSGFNGMCKMGARIFDMARLWSPGKGAPARIVRAAEVIL